MKCQKNVKNTPLNFPESSVMSPVASFGQTTAHNTKTPHLLSYLTQKSSKSSHLRF